MTAISFLLCLVGWLMVNILGSKFSMYPNKWDLVGCTAFILGFLGLTGMIFYGLWKMLP